MAGHRSGDATPQEPDPAPGTARRAVTAGAIGNFVEWYDFVLYGASAPVLAVVFFSDSDPQTALLSTFATFGVAFVARPFGAFFLGNLGDRLGRRNVLAAVVLAMSVGTAAIALLPGYAQIGVWAPVLLVLIRALQGFTAGGEFGGSATFIVEYAPPGHRGRYGAWQTATVGLGSATATATVLLASALLSTEQLYSWGWRIPFALALPLGLVGLYLRLRLEETPDFRRVREGEVGEAAPASLPVVEALRRHGRMVLIGAAVVTGGTVSTYVFHNFLPAFLNTDRGVPLPVALGGTLVGLVVYAASTVVWGSLSDRWGRRPVLLGGALALMAVMYPALRLGEQGTVAAIALGQSMFGLAAAAVMGVLPALLCELFPTAVRMSGLSVAYTLANAVFGGTAPFLVLWLVGVFDGPWVAVAYCVLALAATVVGGLLLPGGSTFDDDGEPHPTVTRRRPTTPGHSGRSRGGRG